MFLTASNLYFYLRDAGLVDAQDIVEGRFAVTEIGRRNRNFIVHREPLASLFVKQVPMQHPEVIAAVRREAACNRLARTLGGGSSTLASSIPQLLRYDPVHHVLVYAHLPGRHDLNRHVARFGPVSTDLARTFGGVLGACHAETSLPGALLEIVDVLTGEPPWILRILRRPDLVMPGMNAGRRAMLDMVRGMPAAAMGLEGLQNTWRHTCLVHGDVKNDNILVSRDDAAGTGFTVIDWELADLGEPAWDVAAALFSFLQPSLFAAPYPVAGAPARAPAGAFWAAYREAAGPLAPSTPFDVARIGSMVGARAVQFAFELLPDTQPSSPYLGRVLDVARVFFEDPPGAMAGTFGLAASLPWAPPQGQNASRTLWRVP